MLYALYLSDPSEWNVRKLSEKFGISVARVEAVLRLKELEESWKKVRLTSFILFMDVIVRFFNDVS
jgi:Eukaryotic mitochondrial regulator protein